MRLAEINALDRDAFVAAFGGVFEHSPWIAARAFDRRPFATVAALHEAMVAVMHDATPDEQLVLIRAHPELAGRAMVRDQLDGSPSALTRCGACSPSGRPVGLTADSASEQSAAGLTQCSPDEYARLVDLNARYNAKFGFPFILAVKGYDRRGVIAEFARRVERDVATEFAEALAQIARIASFRLATLVVDRTDGAPRKAAP